MKSTLLHDADGLRTFAVVMDSGDEATGELLTFARERGIGGAAATAPPSAATFGNAVDQGQKVASRSPGTTICP